MLLPLAASVAIWTALGLSMLTPSASQLVLGRWEVDTLATDKILFDTAGVPEATWLEFQKLTSEDADEQASITLEFFAGGKLTVLSPNVKESTHRWQRDSTADQSILVLQAESDQNISQDLPSPTFTFWGHGHLAARSPQNENVTVFRRSR